MTDNDILDSFALGGWAAEDDPFLELAAERDRLAAETDRLEGAAFALPPTDPRSDMLLTAASIVDRRASEITLQMWDTVATTLAGISRQVREYLDDLASTDEVRASRIQSMKVTILAGISGLIARGKA